MDGTLIIHKAIEGLIARYPEHAHWSYKRFKANSALHDIYNIDHETALSKVEQVREEAKNPLLSTPSEHELSLIN